MQQAAVGLRYSWNQSVGGHNVSKRAVADRVARTRRAAVAAAAVLRLLLGVPSSPDIEIDPNAR